jgi:8-oxo-dGTP pyrophosphatase MutT (NUDIX family)
VHRRSKVVRASVRSLEINRAFKVSKKRSRVARAARQVAVIPFSRGRKGVQVCLIRRKGSTNWAIRKGFIDPGDSHKEAALTEAFEEAGLSGQLVGHVLGTYEYVKEGVPLTVAVHLMEVFEQDKTWEETRFRERCWFPVKDALKFLTRHPVRPLLDRARSRLDRDD